MYLLNKQMHVNRYWCPRLVLGRAPQGRRQCDGTEFLSRVRVSEGLWNLYALLPSDNVESGTPILNIPANTWPSEQFFQDCTGLLMAEMSACQGGMG